MLEQLSKDRRNWVLLGLGTLALWLAWSLRAVINPLLLGYLLAFIASPLVRSLESRGWQSRNAVAAVFAGSFLASALILFGLFLQSRSLIEDLLRTAGGPEVSSPVEPGDALESTSQPAPAATLDRPASEVQNGEDSASGETTVGMLQSWLDRADGWLHSLPGSELLPELPSEVEVTSGLRQWLLSDSETGDSVGVQALAVIAINLRRLLDALFGIGELVLLVPLYAFFWMFEVDQLHAWIRRHIPWRHRGQLVRFSGKVGDIVSNFFRGRLVVCVLKGAYLTIFLSLAGVPYPLLLGMAGGFLSLIPFVGGALAFILGLCAGLLVYGPVGALIASGVAFGTAELLEGYVLVPKILGKTLGLSEVGVLFAVTAGGALLGLFGVIVALPLAAAIKVAFQEFVEPALQEFAEEEDTIVTG